MYVVDVGGFCHFCVVSISIRFFFARSYILGGHLHAPCVIICL